MQTMVKLIKFSFGVLWVSLLMNFSTVYAKDGGTYEKNVYLLIAVDLTDTILPKGQPLPTSLDKFPSIEDAIKINSPTSLEIKKTINQLVIVPNTPKIEIPASRESSKIYNGGRIYAVSRKTNLDYAEDAEGNISQAGGSNAVVIDKESKNAWVVWLKEDVIREMLLGISEFNPETQPITYPDLETDAQQIVSDREANKERNEDALNQAKRSVVDERIFSSQTSSETPKSSVINLWPMIAYTVGALACICALALVVKKGRKGRQGSVR